ncbi:MAG: hypothetical protein AAFQ37_14820, partial [Bacteroidota bacterium]
AQTQGECLNILVDKYLSRAQDRFLAIPLWYLCAPKNVVTYYVLIPRVLIYCFFALPFAAKRESTANYERS